MTLRDRSSARDVAGLAVGLGVLVGSALVARGPRGESEIEIFRSANDLPNEAFPPIWTAMQYGTFGAVPVAATVALMARKPRLAGSLALGGTAAWVTAKAAKRVVARGRPASIIGGVQQRGVEEGDQGFPSGHAAVSTAMTVIMWPEASPRMRVTLSALTGLVPFGRMYVGAHLPLDLVGGSALGLALGSTVNLVTARRRAPAAQDLASV
ncbi:MAG TPA: phosphatase PAP2 family protein [Actinomycetota bacterium]|jgi:undecaprenyl-diphosphatase|nr:phosphatase PAP2 family protein [Actinomycetota bacterium]